MGFLILAIIGFGLGAVCVYWLMQQKLDELKITYEQQTRKTVAELEKAHESRMQETIASLQRDYQKDLSQSIEELKKAANSQTQQTNTHPEESQESALAQINEQVDIREYQPSKQSPSEILTTFSPISEQDITVTATESITQSEVEVVADSPETLPQNEIVVTPDSNPEIPLSVTSESPENLAQDGIITPLETIQNSEQNTEDILIKTAPVDTISTIDEQITEQFDSRVNTTHLAENIELWGNSGGLAFIPQLIALIYHPDSHIRKLVTSALGKIAARNPVTSEIQRAIPILGKLTHDSESSVRDAAVIALGNIKSVQVIHFLQIALRDSDIHVVKSAYTACEKFKFYRSNKPIKPIKITSKTQHR